MLERVDRLTDAQLDDLWRLYQHEWWTRGRTKSQVRCLIEQSDVVVAFCEAESRRLVAFARVLTDFAIKAVIFDVIIDSDYRGHGLGRRLFDAVVKHPALQEVQHLELYCLPEVAPFYERWGFTDSLGGLRFMRLARTDPHREETNGSN